MGGVQTCWPRLYHWRDMRGGWRLAGAIRPRAEVGSDADDRILSAWIRCAHWNGRLRSLGACYGEVARLAEHQLRIVQRTIAQHQHVGGVVLVQPPGLPFALLRKPVHRPLYIAGGKIEPWRLPDVSGRGL